MDIRGVGAGPLDQGLSRITPGVPLTKGIEALVGSRAQIGADTVAGLLNELSASQITSLLSIIEPEWSPHRIAQFNSLVREVSSAAATGDVNGALAKLSALATLDPRRAEALTHDSALAPIRKDVEALLARFNTAARLDAEALVQDATRIVQVPGDADGATLLLLAARLIEAGGFANRVHSADVSRMVIENRSPSPPVAAQLDELLRAAVAAVRDDNASEALAKLAAFASLDPRRAQSLAFEPALAPIAKDVEALLTRLAVGAQRDAETRLQEAKQYLQATGDREYPIENVQPWSHLLLAASLIDAGGYANCVRSAEVSQMVIDQSRWAPADIASHLPERDGPRIRIRCSATGIRGRMLAARLKNLWRRAPLLVLLLGWLAVGVAGGSLAALFREDWPASIVAWFFEIWALGFLALVSFGFYMRVRNR